MEKERNGRQDVLSLECHGESAGAKKVELRIVREDITQRTTIKSTQKIVCVT
jgi:hypothetical protein